MTAARSGRRRDRLPLCGAKKRQGSGTCARPAGWGTDHAGAGRCKLHGGSTPGQVVKAREEQARAAMVTYGHPVDVESGSDSLWEELRYTAGHVEWLRLQIQALPPEAITWGVSKRKSEGVAALSVEATEEGVDLDLVPSVGVETTESAGVHALVKLYLEERKHKVEVAATIVKIGLDERRVRLEEEKGALLVVGLQWLFTELGLSAKKLELANQLAITMLRSLADGRPPVAGEVVA